MAYGLTSTGFVPKTQDVVRAEIEARLRASFSPSIPLGDKTLLGITNAIYSEREALLWELVEIIVNSQDPDAAFGAILEQLAALTGTVKDPPRPSTVTLSLTGDPATVVATGNRAKTSVTAKLFATTASATITLATSWAATTAYVVGDIRKNNSRIYRCTVAGTSAGAGGPTGTGTTIVDNTVTWRYLGEGTGYATAAAACTEDGPTEAVAFDITVIDTPVAGWLNVTNILDAVKGANEDTDAELRLKREEELAARGTSPIPAITADLLQVKDVTAVTVFHNTTDTTDADGVPAHNIEALVQGGADADIRQALFDGAAGGIGTHGGVSGTVVDSEGNSHTIKFSRPTLVPIYVDVVLVKYAAEYPADGDAQVKAAITAWGAARSNGDNVTASAVLAQVFKVAGVLEVSMPEIGLAANPTTSTTIVITPRQLATFDTSRITVTTSNGTP